MKVPAWAFVILGLAAIVVGLLRHELLLSLAGFVFVLLGVVRNRLDERDRR